MSKSKLLSARSILFMPLTEDYRMRSDSSGMIHWMKDVMPCFLFFKIGLTVLTSSIKIFLSDLLISESLKPGVSMRVILPVRATLTHDVTAANDFDALNLLATYYLAPKHSFENILAISERAVDLPCPHSPKIHAENKSAKSLSCFCYIQVFV